MMRDEETMVMIAQGINAAEVTSGVYARREHMTPKHDKLMVSIDISNVRFR